MSVLSRQADQNAGGALSLPIAADAAVAKASANGTLPILQNTGMTKRSGNANH